METGKKSIGTRTKMSASMADLAGKYRISSINSNSFSFSFVLDKALQLIEAPIAEPVIHLSASSQLPYSPKVFHYNPVSIKAGNNILADVVVIPSHKTSFSSSKLPEKPLAGMSAFGLQFTTQISKSSFNLLDLTAIIEFAIRSDSKIVYSDINTKNFILQNRVISSDVFGECEKEEASAFSVYPQQAFLDIPVEVFFITARNIKFKFLPFVEQSQDKNISFEVGTSWEVISDRSFIDDRLAFRLLNHPARLLDAGNGKLGWQSESLSQSTINEWMQLDIVSNLFIPGSVNTELQSFSISLDNSDYLWSASNLDFSYCSALHSIYIEKVIYKTFGGSHSSQS